MFAINVYREIKENIVVNEILTMPILQYLKTSRYTGEMQNNKI